MEENYEENLKAMLAAFKAVLDALDEDFFEGLQSDVKKCAVPPVHSLLYVYIAHLKG